MHDITMTSPWHHPWHHHDIIYDIIHDIMWSHHMTSSWHHRWHHHDTCHLAPICTWQVAYTSVQRGSRQHIQCICIHTSFILVLYINQISTSIEWVWACHWANTWSKTQSIKSMDLDMVNRLSQHLWINLWPKTLLSLGPYNLGH